MKVLIIPSWYPEGKDKLMGIYHKDYAYALSKNNVEVDMLHIKNIGLREVFKYIFMKKLEIEHEKNYTVYKLKMLNIKKISFKLFMHIYTKKLEKLYKYYIKNHTKPDIFHAQVTLPAGYATCKLGKKYNIPVVVTEHYSKFMDFFNNENKNYGLYVINNSTYSTVSNLMKKELSNITTKCEIIPNLVDTDKYKVKRYKRNKKLNLVSICALRKGKGIEYIIEALSILINKKNIKDVHLNIVGDGYLLDYYKEIANEFNVNNYITFYGQKNKDEIVNILAKNDILVVGSNYETFCIPGIEALSSGIPIVSTRCGGIEEYLDKKCGELCEIKNPKDMANKIEYVYKNIDKYDINYLRNVANKFSYKNVCNIAKKIYKKL